MKERENEQANNNMMNSIIIGFVSLLIFFMILGSSFNEVMMLGLFFMFLGIAISSYIESCADNDEDEES